MAQAFAAPIPAPDINYRGDWQAQEQAYIEQLATLAKRNGKDPRIGRTVRFQIADGYAVYVVWKVKPLQLVHVNTGDGYQASAATIRGLRLADVDAQLRFDDFWQGKSDEHEEYVSSLPVGTVVHYDSGFAQFIRMVRVEGERGKRFRPIALVGNWDGMDLPRRMPDGSVSNGHRARAIESGEAFEPNVSCIWEALDAKGKAWAMRGLTSAGTAHLNDIGRARFAEKRYQAPFDPAKEPAIDLTIPPPTAEEQALAALMATINDVRKAVEHGAWNVPDAEAIIAKVREAVTA